MSHGSSVTQQKKRILGQKECPSPILVICANEIRKEHFVREILDAYLGKDRSKTPLVRIDLSELNKDSLRKLENEIMALSLFEPVRYFFLGHAEELPASLLKPLSEMAAKAPPHSKLIFAAKKLPASNPIHKLCKKSDGLVDLPPLSDNDTKKWIEKELAGHGIKKFPKDLPEALLQRAEGDLDRLAPLVEWVSLLSDGDELARESLGSVLAEKDEYSEFALIDAIAERDRGKSLRILENLLANGAIPFVFLSMVASRFSRYATIRDHLDSGSHPKEIMEALGVDPNRSWAFEKKDLPAARRRSKGELMTALIHIFQADTKLKNKSLGSESIMSELVDRLVS